MPRLAAEKLGAPGVVSAAGGGSARTWQESIAQQPRAHSAPTTARSLPTGAGASKSPPQAVPMAGQPAQPQRGWVEPPGQGSDPRRARLDQAGMPEAAGPMPDQPNRDFWSLCRNLAARGFPAPDDNPAEVYRPPIELFSEAFLRSSAPVHPQIRPPHESEQAGTSSIGGQSAVVHSAAGSTSIYSSASSAGSTPSGGRGRRPSPRPSLRGHLHQSDPKLSTMGRHHHLSGTTVTPASSPQGSAASTGNLNHTATTAQGPAASGLPSAPAHGRAVGSREGSRGSSPWHLPSPTSELSTASERLNSSEACGSDSCGETLHYGGTHCNFEGCAYDDQSQSDTPGAHYPRSNQLSDSDCTTPRSHDCGQGNKETDQERGAKDSQHALWENVRSEVARVRLTGDRIPRRLDTALSPGSAGTGNFRQAVGMDESGPVIPFGSSGRHRAKRLAVGAPGTAVQGAENRPGGSSAGSASGSSAPRGRTADAANRVA